MAFAAVFLILMLASPSVLAKQHNIDWTLSGSYSNLATESFTAGDTLVFTYDNTHTVDVVSKSDYDSCSSSNALSTNTKSPTTITLKEGPTYIICGTPGHCQQGMKLQVTAKAVGSSSGGSTPSTTPSSGSGSAASPSGSTPSSPSSAGALKAAVPVALGALLVAFWA